MKCAFCGGSLIWQSDFNYDEVYADGDGIVSIYTCAECGADAQFSLKNEEEENGKDN